MKNIFIHILLKQVIVLLIINISISTILIAQKCEWVKNVGGEKNDQGQSIAIDKNKNVYLAGDFESTITFGKYMFSSAGENDIFIAKYNQDGECIWAIRGGGKSNDYISDIAIDASDNIYIMGHCSYNTIWSSIDENNMIIKSSERQNFFIAKYNSDGKIQWIRQVENDIYSDIQAFSMAIDIHDNIYITGFLYGTVLFGDVQFSNPASLYLFIAKYNTNGECISGTTIEDDKINDSYSFGFCIDTDKNGNIYVGGGFYGTIKLGNKTITSLGKEDIFIAKYNQNWECEWSINGGGDEYDYCNNLIIDSIGNIYIACVFENTAIFDNHTIKSAGKNDILIAKYNQDGVFQWIKTIGGPNQEILESIDIDTSGYLYITGHFIYNTHIDKYNLISYGNTDVFIAKYNPLGECNWAINLGGNSADMPKKIKTDIVGNIYLTGSLSSNLYPDTISLNSYGGNDVFLAKYTNSIIVSNDITICKRQKTKLYASYGVSYIWSNGDSTSSITVTPLTTTKYYVTGMLSTGTKMIDSVLVTVKNDKAKLKDLQITKNRIFCKNIPFELNVNGGHNYQWSNGSTSQSIEFLTSKSGYYYVTVTDTINCYYDIDSVYIKVIDDCTVNGQVFYDINKNKLWDFFEKGLKDIKIKIHPGGYAISDNYGKFISNPGKTNCQVMIELDNNSIWELSTPNNIFDINYNDTGSMSQNIIFGLKANRLFKDFEINIFSDIHRNGTPVNHYVNVKNKGTVEGKTSISYNFNPTILEFISCDKCENVTIHENNITFETDTISINDSRQYTLHFKIKLGTTGAKVFTYACSKNDYFGEMAMKRMNSNNNCDSLAPTVVASYDPNDKQAKWSGMTANKKYVGNDKTIKYTIRFQNTGNDTAVNIWITDTLSVLHNYSSIELLASSHDVITVLDSNGILKFMFYDIMLPDSNVNERLSHGFVSFYIRLQDTIKECTEIKNKVGIYFDFNDPVITNEVSLIYSTLFAYAGKDTTITFGDQITLCANNGNNYTYKWSHNRGKEQTITVAPYENTNYKLTVYDQYGCYDTCSINIFVKYADGINQVLTRNDSFTIFPNPTNNILNIEKTTLNNKVYKVEIFDIYGKLIMTSQLIEKISLEINHLENGVYIIKIENQFFKIIVNN